MIRLWLIPALALTWGSLAHATGFDCVGGVCNGSSGPESTPPAAANSTATATGQDYRPDNEGAKETTGPVVTPGGIDTGKEAATPRPTDTQGTRGTGKGSSDFGNVNDPPRVRAAKLESAGQDRFYNGVQQVAIGIAQLSQAEQDRKGGAPKGETEADRNQAIQRLGQGNHDINLGRDMVKHAGAIRASEDRLATGGASGSAASSTPYQYNGARAPEATTEALETMQEVAGVSPQSLIDAVNHGGSDQILDLAAGAQGVEIGQAQLAAAMPSFPVSESYAVSSAAPGLGSGLPSAPVWSGTPKAEAKPDTRSAASVPAPLAAKPRREASGREETLQPLATDQLFGSLERKAVAASDEFGDPSADLFGRVRGQLTKRRSELKLTKR